MLFDTGEYDVKNTTTNSTSVELDSGDRLDHSEILDPFIEFLQENPFLSVEVVGYTDAAGTVEDNLTLSQNRALAVYNYLTDPATGGGDIDPSRVTMSFRGESDPIVPNGPAGSTGGTLLNRRVELIVNYWEPLTDFMPSLSISSIAVSPLDNEANPVTPATPLDKLVIFAGTGSRSASDFSSRDETAIGLLRSTDGGESWEILHPTLFEGSVINAVAVAADGELWVATDGNRTSGIGLYHSSDFGDSMRPVEPAEGLPAAAVADLAVDPSNAYLIYAGVPGEGIFKRSRDGIWNAVNTGLSGFERASRIELAVSKSLDPNSRTHPVYAALIGEITDYTIGTNAGDDFFFVGSNTLLQPGDTVTISDSEFPFLQESRLILSIERDGDRCKVTLDAPLHHSIGGTVTSVADHLT